MAKTAPFLSFGSPNPNFLAPPLDHRCFPSYESRGTLGHRAYRSRRWGWWGRWGRTGGGRGRRRSRGRPGRGSARPSRRSRAATARGRAPPPPKREAPSGPGGVVLPIDRRRGAAGSGVVAYAGEQTNVRGCGREKDHPVGVGLAGDASCRCREWRLTGDGGRRPAGVRGRRRHCRRPRCFWLLVTESEWNTQSRIRPRICITRTRICPGLPRKP